MQHKKVMHSSHIMNFFSFCLSTLSAFQIVARICSMSPKSLSEAERFICGFPSTIHMDRSIIKAHLGLKSSSLTSMQTSFPLSLGADFLWSHYGSRVHVPALWWTMQRSPPTPHLSALGACGPLFPRSQAGKVLCLPET